MSRFRLSDFGFRLSDKSKWGIVALLILLACLILIRYSLPFFVAGEDDTERRMLALQWEAYQRRHAVLAQADTADSSQARQVALFPFDPNLITKEELFQLGLPDNTVYTWLHYREKGGRFYKKQDLKKLYTLKDKDYDRLEPYIRIQSDRKPQGQGSSQAYQQPVLPPPQSIPLNKADAAALKALPGIGDVLSQRIVAFREALGGFYDVEQLREVYHLPDSTYRKIYTRFALDTSLIKKISLNQATYWDLYRHPYLRPYAGHVIKLREEQGAFTKIRQIRQISLINEQRYRKIAPYLRL